MLSSGQKSCVLLLTRESIGWACRLQTFVGQDGLATAFGASCSPRFATQSIDFAEPVSRVMSFSRQPSHCQGFGCSTFDIYEWFVRYRRESQKRAAAEARYAQARSEREQLEAQLKALQQV
jgi:hypothetical protein